MTTIVLVIAQLALLVMAHLGIVTLSGWLLFLPLILLVVFWFLLIVIYAGFFVMLMKILD